MQYNYSYSHSYNQPFSSQIFKKVNILASLGAAASAVTAVASTAIATLSGAIGSLWALDGAWMMYVTAGQFTTFEAMFYAPMAFTCAAVCLKVAVVALATLGLCIIVSSATSKFRNN